jgi:transposase
MRDYTSKTVYLGLDVHKKTYAVTAVCDGQVVKKDTLPASPEKLIAYCKKYFAGAQIISAYEAGFCGFHLHRALEAVGIKNLVVHAAGIEIAVGDKVKTDKRDSLKIATHLSQGRLTSIHVPTPEREANRAVTRLRDTLARDRARIGNRLKSLLHTRGIISPDDNRIISLKWVNWCQTLQLDVETKIVVNEHIAMWIDLNNRLKKITDHLKEQAKQDHEIEKVYQSVPGIGDTSARILANELQDTLQFRNERQLFSFIGLTPSEYSSGEHVRQGHITRQGRATIRKVLVQVAWVAVRHDVDLCAIFAMLSKRIGARKAIVAIARKLMGRIRACFRTKTTYCTRSELALAPS